MSNNDLTSPYAYKILEMRVQNLMISAFLVNFDTFYIKENFRNHYKFFSDILDVVYFKNSCFMLH